MVGCLQAGKHKGKTNILFISDNKLPHKNNVDRVGKNR